MSILIVDKKNCSGCSACYSVCEKKCITMHADMSGFWYPVVDHNSCVECKLCEYVCPIIHSDRIEQVKPLAVYAAWSFDQNLRFTSTSGGVFSEVAGHVVEQDGYVVGATYGEACVIEHQIVNDMKGISDLKQSKYAQSDMGDIFKAVKARLTQGDLVLFCGAPCQVAGLKFFLRKDYSNLITCDFICRGVNSPKAYHYWLKEIEETYGTSIRRVWFKYKEDGWKKSPRCTRIDLNDGRAIVQKGSANSYMCGYLGPNLYIRPSCTDCRFKGNYRMSDITLGDFWGVNRSLDNDQGTSMLQVNSEKGQRLVDDVKNRIQLTECSPDSVAYGNVCMDHSVKLNPKSEEFLQRLGQDIPFSRLVQMYTPKKSGLKVTVKRVIKRVFRERLDIFLSTRDNKSRN